MGFTSQQQKSNQYKHTKWCFLLVSVLYCSTPALRGCSLFTSFAVIECPAALEKGGLAPLTGPDFAHYCRTLQRAGGSWPHHVHAQQWDMNAHTFTCLLAYLAQSFHSYSPGTPSKGMVPATTGQIAPEQISKTVPHRHAQPNEDNPSLRVSSQDFLDHIKLKLKATIITPNHQ